MGVFFYIQTIISGMCIVTITSLLELQFIGFPQEPMAMSKQRPEGRDTWALGEGRSSYLIEGMLRRQHQGIVMAQKVRERR